MSRTWFRGAVSDRAATVVATLLALALLSSLATQAGVEERPGPDASEPVERILQEVRQQLDAGDGETASLWAVEDEAVRQWMAELYRNHYLEGQTTAEAVRAASLEVLQQRRKRKQTTHPFYWAGFVATGDWR